MIEGIKKPSGGFTSPLGGPIDPPGDPTGRMGDGNGGKRGEAEGVGRRRGTMWERLGEPSRV